MTSSDWFIFLKCRGDMLHEQFTRGDLACSSVVLSLRHVPPFQNDLNSGDRSRAQNFVPATRFFMKTERSHDGICRGDKYPRHDPATCPLVCADLKAMKSQVLHTV